MSEDDPNFANTMIGRIATALEDELGEGRATDSLRDVFITGRCDLISAAHAVLAAMLEPTEVMLAATDLGQETHEIIDQDIADGIVRQGWAEMIDAALAEIPAHKA